MSNDKLPPTEYRKPEPKIRDDFGSFVELPRNKKEHAELDDGPEKERSGR